LFFAHRHRFEHLTLLFLSQRSGIGSLWRMTSNWGQVWLRVSAGLLRIDLLMASPFEYI